MKIKKEYTPGPWRLMEMSSTTNIAVRDDAGIICEVYKGGETNGNRNKGETSATANLISAAPDLVDALIEMCKKAHAYNDQTGTVDNTWEESKELAEDYWHEMLTDESRAALEKAGVIEKP